MQKTYVPKAGEITQEWVLVDASTQTLGRLASKIASVLLGKNKPNFTPGMDTGDFVVVINSDHIQLSGAKWTDKKYYTHSRYFGGIKSLSAAEQREKDSTFIVTEAVKGMLPKNKLSRDLIKKLKVYGGSEHPHTARVKAN